MALTDYSEQTIAEVIIIGGMLICALSVNTCSWVLVKYHKHLFQILTFCSIIAWCRRYTGHGESSAGRRRSSNSIVRTQSQSVVRGEHPMAFMLPSVSLSEVSMVWHHVMDTDDTLS